MSGTRDEKPLPIVQYWHEESVPGYIGDLLSTFRSNNPDFRHMVFHRRQAAEFISGHVGARESDAFGACAVPAMQADYFRYCAVLVLGGIYSDADFKCVARLRPLLPPAKKGRLFRGPGGNVINGLFSFGAPSHPFLKLALEVATVNIERRTFDDVFRTTGPPIFMTLSWLQASGSFDALIEWVAGTRFEEFVVPYCETIGDYGRVERAFEGIRVAAPGDHDAFVCLPDVTLPYKHTEMHWVKFKRGIFT